MLCAGKNILVCITEKNLSFITVKYLERSQKSVVVIFYQSPRCITPVIEAANLEICRVLSFYSRESLGKPRDFT